MDFMPGGDLFQMLVHGTGARGAFAPAAARFYASEVFLALEFLHRREFVYRDLKPENVLVDVGGHVKLADLGFCKRVAPGERTYTTCGTSDYMAPEVMLSQGTTRAPTSGPSACSCLSSLRDTRRSKRRDGRAEAQAHPDR